MAYSIKVSKKAEKDLMLIPLKDRGKISQKIDELALEPRPDGCLKLKGRSQTLWRVRSGNYRILYAVDDQVRIVDVRRVGDRKDIYN